MLARQRLASSASPVLRAIAARDHEILESRLLERELEILRAQRANLPPHQRPHYKPEQRLAILQLMRLRNWNADRTADRLVLHANTIRAWLKELENGGCRLSVAPWNKIHDVVRWLACEIRRLCPEPELGVRQIANHIVHAGLSISKSSVQRILKNRPPQKPIQSAIGCEPTGVLSPRTSNRTWHMDLMMHGPFWARQYITVIIDGFSRKSLSIRNYSHCPTTDDLIKLVRHTCDKFGTPGFLITDHGGQFKTRFRVGMNDLDIRLVKGRPRQPSFNGKVERFFRTLRIWLAPTLLPFSQIGKQRRLNDFVNWYNRYRPHQSLGAKTPDEAWHGVTLPDPVPIRSNDEYVPSVDVRRVNYRGDPRLPILDFDITWETKIAA